MQRRRFIQSLGCVAASVGCANASQILSAVIPEHDASPQHAKYQLQFYSPYDSAKHASSPHMHQEFKRNIERLTKGKVYVEVIDKGQGGVGTQLMTGVSRGKQSAALISVANLMPVAPTLDALNIPFWIESQQHYINLLTSKTFHQSVLKPILAQNRIAPLFWYLPGFRTLTSTKTFAQPLMTPDQLVATRVRVPPSDTLAQMYTMLGARTRAITWDKVSRAARTNVIDVLDSGLIGLCSGPDGLRHQLSNIVSIDSVYDGWVAVVSQAWLARLDKTTRLQVQEAAELTYLQHQQKVPLATKLTRQAFTDLGVSVIQPSTEEKAQWVDACGYQRPEWNRFKQQAFGDLQAFEQLRAAAQGAV